MENTSFFYLDTEDMWLESVQYYDSQLFSVINGAWRNAFFDQFMPLISDARWFWIFLAGVTIFWVARKGFQSLRPWLLPALMLGMAVGTTDLATTVIKDLANRLRPLSSGITVHYVEDGEWRMRTPQDKPGRSRDSFYSAHAANSMAAAAVICAFVPGVAPAAYLVPLVVGYSRIYLGRHYPLDVLAGWLVGWCIARAYLRVHGQLRRRQALPA